jgi:hypothetical protein
MKYQLAFIVIAALPACKSSDAKSSESDTKSSDSVPCAPAGADLAKKLYLANGYNLDLTKPDVQKQIATAKTEVMGKKVALDGCFFKMQGNDRVTFAATADAKDSEQIECVMAGGEDGNKKFRHAAMKFDMAKLRLDVKGTVAEHGQPPFKRIYLTECEIVPHD